MSKEGVPEVMEPAKESIPVCTLFSDDSVADTDDTFESKGDSVSTLVFEQVPHEQVERKPSEPALCNVFAGSEASIGSGDDIFSKISSETSEVDLNSQASENTLSTDVSTSAMETLRLNRSVDSFIVEDLTETDVTTENQQPISEALESSQEPEPETLERNFPDPSACAPGAIATSESSSTEGDVSSRELPRKPVIATPSFISVTSFSISPDEASSIGQDSTGHSMSESASVLASEMGGLTIEDVKKEDFKHDLPPVAESETIQPMVAKHEQHAGPEPTEELSTENQTTESLFSSSQDNQQNSFFSSNLKSDTAEEDDPFAAALSNSALDRRRDAWLPSEETKTILMAFMVNQKAPDLEMEKITRPGLSTSEILEYPVKGLVTRLTGSESVVRRQNLTTEDVTQDRVGIEKLLNTGNHRSAANLCAKLLATHGQGFGQATQMTTNTPETLWLWFTRIYILTKLKQFEMAAMELSAFKNLENPDLYFEFYPNIYPGRRGSMVPFEFRLLHAEFPRHLDKPQESLNRLHKILGTCKKILNHLGNGKNEIGEIVVLNATDVEASIKFWSERKVHVLFCIGNTLIHLKEYVLAVEVYDEILKLCPADAVMLESGIGRLFLHIGDIRAAQQRFTAAEKDAGNDSQYKVQLLINRGFMYIGTNNWKEAFAQFESALNLEPQNITALNNKAVCLLYLGRLKDAIAILEEGVGQQANTDVPQKLKDVNRKQAMTQGLLLNLSTLYELESSHFVLKKRGLFLKHIAPTCGDSFDTACFKEI